jgi:hypothetical protein
MKKNSNVQKRINFWKNLIIHFVHVEIEPRLQYLTTFTPKMNIVHV